MTETAATPHIERYPQAIRVAHWMIVGLVVFQFFTGGGMEQTFKDGQSVTSEDAGTALVHALLGSMILITMLWRLAVRLRSPVPPPPETEPDTLQKVSRGVHYAFYAILIGMPLAGALALLTGSEVVATVHGWTSWLLLILAIAHIAGAMWHLSKRDGVVQRMIGYGQG